MKRVHRANNLLEAQLVADVLTSLGIVNHILNAHAVGAMGELPFSQTSPEIWIADPALYARTLEIIAASSAPVAGPDKICPFCNERNPAHFLSCWQCASALAA